MLDALSSRGPEITFASVARVNQPETGHTVSLGKLQAWLDGGAKSPNEFDKHIEKKAER